MAVESVFHGGSKLVAGFLDMVTTCLGAVSINPPDVDFFAPVEFEADSRIYMAGAVEEIAAEVIELAGNVARDRGQDEPKITIRDVMAAVDHDEELLALGRHIGWESLFEPERVTMQEEATAKELRLFDVKNRTVGHTVVVRTFARLIGFGRGSPVSKAWYTIYENDTKEQLKSDEVKWKLVSRNMKNEKIVPKLRRKSLVLSQMDWIVGAPEALVKKFVRCYIMTHIHNGVSDSDWPSLCESEVDWMKQMLTKFDVKVISRNDWPEELKGGEFCSIINECHNSNTQLIAEIVTDVGSRCQNLETMTLCGVPVDMEFKDDQVERENADDIVDAINALALTNQKITAFDMDTVPTNDNVVNVFTAMFPKLTSFSATNGVFGENISDVALDALRVSHPGITITIRTQHRETI